jgi:hypothetical protein
MIVDFWSWFEANRAALQATKPDQAVDMIFPHVHAIDSRIGIEVTLDTPRPELVLTAYGNAELFPLVRQIAALAPRYLDWNIVALKPGRGFDFEIHFGDSSVNASQLPFEPLEAGADPQLLGICVFLPMRKRSEEDWPYFARVILTSGIGDERVSEIDHIEVGDLENAPVDPLRLAELEAFLDWRRKKDN